MAIAKSVRKPVKITNFTYYIKNRKKYLIFFEKVLALFKIM